MKNYNFIESANQSIKSISKNLREANREYTSLSRVLKDMQRNDLLKKGYQDAFAALGFVVDDKQKFTPAQMWDVTDESQWIMAKVRVDGKYEEQPFMGIWGFTQKKDADGNKLFEQDGITPVMEAICRKVNAWTPNKVFKVLAQARAIAADKNA